MIDFVLHDGTPLDAKLATMWDVTGMDTTLNYEEFVKSLDSHIVNIKVNEDYESIIITFESEEHLTWFILKWS